MNVVDGNVSNGAVMQGLHHSSMVIHNGKSCTLSDEESELLRLFKSLDVKRRMKILDLTFSLEEEAKAEKSE